jgi:hypothetical protein
MNELTKQETLFGPNTGSERHDVIREDRYVVTHHGEVVASGTHAQCMEKLYGELQSWHLQHEEDYAASRREPYVHRSVVGWALPGEKSFLWSHQSVFADDATPDPDSGLLLHDFLFKLSGEATRIFVNKKVAFLSGQGWLGHWKDVMQAHAERDRAAAISH